VPFEPLLLRNIKVMHMCLRGEKSVSDKILVMRVYVYVQGGYTEGVRNKSCWKIYEMNKTKRLHHAAITANRHLCICAAAH
jgi:hypothetical protein